MYGLKYTHIKCNSITASKVVLNFLKKKENVK
jgi:hypothetical protein